MGNPDCTLLVADLAEVIVAGIGPTLQNHVLLQKANERPSAYMTPFFWIHWRIIGLVLLMASTPFEVNATSLLGDYPCIDWGSMERAAKKTWINSFLAPLSLAFKSVQVDKRDLYNPDSRSADDAVAYVDNYCSLHTVNVAADGAGAYFKLLIGQ